MSVVIKKAKIKGDTLEVEYEETTPDGTATVKKAWNARIHQDLRDAFKELNVHLSELCEQYSKEGFGFMESGINCTGYSLGGADEHAGVTLIGQRELENKRILNLVSPFVKWEDENAAYYNIEILETAIDKCTKEVLAYLFKGKHAPDPQGKLSFPPAPPKPNLN